MCANESECLSNVSFLQILNYKFMEDYVIQLECHVKELLDTTDQLLELLVHFPLVWLSLAPVIHKAVVDLLVLFLTQSFENLIFLLVSLADNLGLELRLGSLFLNLERLLLCKGCHRLVQDVLVHILNLIENLAVHSRNFDLTIIVLNIDLIERHAR